MKEFTQLTYFGLLLAVFANQLCLPVPSVFFLMAAGALSGEGRCARASLFVWGSQVVSRRTGYGFGSDADGVLRL